MFQEAKARNCDAISNALSFTNEVKADEQPTEDNTENTDENDDEQEEEQPGQVFGA